MRPRSYTVIYPLLAVVLFIVKFRFLVEDFVWSTDRVTGEKPSNVAILEDQRLHVPQIGKNSNHVLLVIGVLNKLTSSKRRDAVRSTWMSDCDRLKVVCKFFVDSITSLSGNDLTRIKEEISTNHDIVDMPYKGGVKFTLRLLWMFKWAMKHFTFDYFLRIDDDHFLCLDRLVYELPHRPKNSLYWGFIHCREKIVRVDEGWLLLTHDLIQEALSKLNTTLQCHPFADQAVSLWMIQSQFDVTYFYDNERVIHEATGLNANKFATVDICDKYMSLHGSYPRHMRMYWAATQQRRLQVLKTRGYNIPVIPRYEDKCKFSNKVFDFQSFYPEFRFDTKPCKDEPEWSNGNDEFQGREEKMAKERGQSMEEP